MIHKTKQTKQYDFFITKVRCTIRGESGWGVEMGKPPLTISRNRRKISTMPKDALNMPYFGCVFCLRIYLLSLFVLQHLVNVIFQSYPLGYALLISTKKTFLILAKLKVEVAENYFAEFSLTIHDPNNKNLFQTK